jgi:hypothetical protein
MGMAATVIGLDGTTSTNATNHPARTRTTEADLIRERKERPGLDLDYANPADLSETKPEKPVIQDPVLGRALDLIKGIAAIRQSRAP